MAQGDTAHTKYPQHDTRTPVEVWDETAQEVPLIRPNFLKLLVIQSLLLGIFVSVLAYFFIKLCIQPNRLFSYYLLYALFLIILLYINDNNELFLWVSGQVAYISSVSLEIELLSGAGMVIFYLLFCREIFLSEQESPGIRKLLLYLVLGFVFDLVLAFVLSVNPNEGDFPWLTGLTHLRTLFFYGATVVFFYVVFASLQSKNKFILFQGWTSIFLIIGGAVFAALDHFPSWIANPQQPYWFFEVMCIIQIFLFAFFLTYRGKQLEEERQELQSLAHAKSRFFANISHEFQTPLTLILGPVSDVLKKADTSISVKNQLKLVFNNAQRLVRLIDQMLDLSKLDVGVLPINRQWGDFSLFCQGILDGLGPLADQKGLRMVFESHPATIQIPFDRDHMEKIIQNLLTNAIKFSAEKGMINLSITYQSHPGELCVVVKDEGKGIPLAFQRRIFDRFFQVNAPGFTREFPGAGIGLALTKELVELNGGTIELESKPAHGSTFTIIVPVSEDLPLENLPPKPGSILSQTQTSPHALDPPQTQPIPWVLLIEDNPEMGEYLTGILASTFRLIHATDGQAGVALAIQHIPDIIITDVMMPLKDGFQVTQELKSHELTGHIPIVILTGKSSHESKLKGLEVDAEVYLTKPFDAAELVARIQGLLRNRLRVQAYYSKNLSLMFNPSEGRQLSHKEAFLQKVLRCIQDNLDNEQFSVEDLSSSLAIDRTQVFRKLKALTGKSPIQVIRAYRLQHAHRLLEAKTGTVAEISFQVGFSDPSYFGKCFKAEFGYSPGKVGFSQTDS